MMKKIIFIILLFFQAFSFAQSLNNYKYVIIPDKFSFQTINNEIILNIAVKAAIEKYGFICLNVSNKIVPNDLTDLNKLFVDINLETKTENAKVKIIFKDSQNKILYTSKEGSAIDKNIIVASNMAFSLASNSLRNLNYIYDKYAGLNLIDEQNSDDKEMPSIINNKSPIAYNAVKYKRGYKLMLNNESVYELTKTSREELFLATKKDTFGVVIHYDEDWFFEYSKNNEIVSERIVLNFTDTLAH